MVVCHLSHVLLGDRPTLLYVSGTEYKSNNRKLKQNTQQNIAVNDLWQQNNLYDTIYK